MKRFFLLPALFCILLVFLGSCSNDDEISSDEINANLLVTATESLVIDNENYILNGFIGDYEDGIITLAELVKESKTQITPAIEVVKIFFIKNDKVYQESSPIKMNPVDTFTLVSRAENLPSWTLDTNTQMVAEVKNATGTFLIKDIKIEQ
ncbi:MAG: hypothetical protein AAGI07_16740 [Bacteroidota bacterium]